MTTAIKRRRGTTVQHSTFTGLEGELTVDTTKDTVVVHDGATAGGFALLREDLSNNTNVASISTAQTFTNKTINLSSNTLTGTTAQFNTALSDGDFATLAGTETLSNKTFSTNPTISSGTANGVAYLNGSKVLTSGSALTFDGTNFATTGAVTAGSYSRVTNGTIDMRMELAPGLGYVGTVTNHPVAFEVNSAEQMRLTSTGLGIGTSSPGYKLTVDNGYIGVRSGNGITFLNAANNSTSAINNTAASGSSNLYFQTPSGNMTLDSSGNLGLGVTPSAWSGLAPAIETSYGSLSGYSTGYMYFAQNAYYAGAWKYKNTAASSYYAQQGGQHQWWNAPSGTAGSAISFTQAMTLDSSSNLTVLGSGYFNGGVAGQGAVVSREGSTGGAFYGSAQGLVTIASSGAYPVTFQTNSSERMRIDSSGNVGIGTSSPSTYGGQFVNYRGTGSFTYLGHSNSGTFPRVSAIGLGSDAVGFTYTSSGSSVYLAGSAQIAALQSAASNAVTDLAFYTTAGGSVAERMRIDSSGNVGIGTSSPRSKLDWYSQATGQLWYVAKTGTSVASYIGKGSSDNSLQYYLDEAANQIWYTSATERMRIDSSGNLLVGTTSQITGGSAYGGFGGEKFTVSTGTNAVIFSTTGGDGSGVPLSCARASDGPFTYWFKNGTAVGNISVSGSTTSYNTSSDYRLKENIQPMHGALDVVVQLNPVTYTWKADGSDGQGFIAHELQAVVPDCVTGEKDAVDAEGKPVYQGIDTSFLSATLAAAIKELHEIVKSQAAEIAELKAKLA